MAAEHKRGWLGAGSLFIYRLLTWLLLATGLAFAAVILSLRYWILPDIERYRDDIARIVSERSGQRVEIERIEANWEGLRPHLVLGGVTVRDAAGRPAFRFARMEQTLSWLSAAMLDLRFHSLVIHQPNLSIRRDERGVVWIGGVELGEQAGGGGFADWLLRQRDIVVRDATLVWTDARRGAPPLELKQVSLQIYSRGDRHRFGLRAVPPEPLAAPLEVRGDLRGDSMGSLARWRGRLFVQLDHADIAAWRAWVPFPVELARGAGAVRAWLSFEGDRVADLTADVKLSNVLTRLGDGLPELDLTELGGRIGWKRSNAGLEFTTSDLQLVTSSGLVLPPADILLRLSSADGPRGAGGEMRVNALELEPLAALADRLPLGDDARRRLAQFAPRGGLYDLSAAWSGDWRAPRAFSVRGGFRNLALKGSGRIPGFGGVTGSVNASERGGTLSLNSQAARIDMPLVFRAPLAFDSFTAQVAWTREEGSATIRLNSVSFSNAHLAGTVFGNYRTGGSARGVIDLTGQLNRADARHVSRYIPLVVGPRAREWLDQAFLAGSSNDVSLRLKGDLDRFPFTAGGEGVFQVAARVSGGELRYAAGWPTIRGISGDLLFRGSRMSVHARSGETAGAQIGPVRAEISDLDADQPVLDLSGEAQGSTQTFFTFIERTPVSGMINRFTEGWRARGAGQLSLRLAIPLEAPDTTRVAGAYRFAGNAVTFSPDLPALEQASGRLEFTESSVTLNRASGMLLGGPVTVSAATSRDTTVRVTLQGRVNSDGARQAGAPDWARHLRGTTDWSAAIRVRRRDADVVFESTLQGLEVNLPAPLAKSASQRLPLRLERVVLDGGAERLSATLGRIVDVSLVRRETKTGMAIERGVVRFGGPAPEPERDGVWVSGAIDALDADRWLAVLAGSSGGRVSWRGVDLKVGTLDLLRRRYTGLAIKAAAQDGQWRATLSGKELDGEVRWLPEGRGTLVARMNTLFIPGAAPAAPVPAEPQHARNYELPALDISAERFVNNGRLLGRLELRAAAQGRDWRIDSLRIANPESTFVLDGTWRPAGAPPRTQVNVRLEAKDAGKLLARLGYPEGVRRGDARLEGMLSWNGAPYEIDYPSLRGNLLLEARKGQFVKLEPGIGKLLGVLSLQALPRRITLDFRDVFSEGFAFDDIIGTMKIENGIASTDSFRIVGPSARITMSGDIDLARETQALRVRVLPHVSDGVSLAGALVGGPIAGVAAFIAQKVLKDPLGQIVSYEYDIRGTWADPLVTRVKQPTPPEEPPP